MNRRGFERPNVRRKAVGSLLRQHLYCRCQSSKIVGSDCQVLRQAGCFMQLKLWRLSFDSEGRTILTLRSDDRK